MQRNMGFDVARGVAILAVIVGHSAGLGVSDAVVKFCFTFHLPVFFIAAGYFFKPAAVDKAFLAKNARSLLAPYALTGLIALALLQVDRIVGISVPLTDATLAGRVLAVLYGAGGSAARPFGILAIGAIWFLLALFWARLFLAATSKLPEPVAGIAVLAVFAVGYYTTAPVWLPFSVQAGMCATLFLYIGQLIRRFDLLRPGAIHPVLWCVLAGFWAYSSLYGGYLCMVDNLYADGVVYDVLRGVAATLCLIKLGEILGNRLPACARPLAFLGQISLPLFCMHLIELTVVPWVSVLNMLSLLPVPVVVSGLLVRFATIAVLTWLVWLVPGVVRTTYFPNGLPGKK